MTNVNGAKSPNVREKQEEVLNYNYEPINLKPNEYEKD